MKNQITPLVRFWMALSYRENKNGMDDEMARQFAFEETIYEPIDTRFCMAFSEGAGWFLLEASGSAIVKVTECGDMKS